MIEKSDQTQQQKNQSNHYENYLEKEEGRFFSSWKKYYFICLEGLALIYTQNKESKIVLGHIPIENFSYPESSDSRIFQFESDEKIYKLKASNPEEKEKWMKLLANIKREQSDNKERSSRTPSMISEDIKNFKKRNEINNESTKKNNLMNEKVSTLTKKLARIIKKYGYIINQEDAISDEVLVDKEITSLVNIKDPKIKIRMHYGFLYKKHKIHDYFQKRWFFIFSSRPLFDKEYIQDDFDLDPKKQKEWIRFDTLYYFKSDKKPEFKESLGGMEMVNSHKILHFENNEKYYLNLDVGDRIYDFYCDNKFDRDEWFEVLKNSRRTAKEYFASKTKKPRNVELLNVYFQKGEKEFIKKMENEKKLIVGNYDDIMEYEVFEYNQNGLKDLILSTIDGCLSNTPIKKDLLKGYAEYMTKEYLEMVRSFWERLFNQIEHAGILKMSMLLLTFRDSLLELNVNDENLYKNGKELIKIYFKKTYQNILSVIESILKSERETKGIKNENGELQTHGPTDLFEILSQTFDLVKDTKNKTVYKEALLLFKESIKQYLIGIDAVLTNLNIIMENEYLIAVANNSFNMIRLLNDIIDDMKNMEVLTNEEINQGIQTKKLMYTINKVSQNAISTFVSQFRLELGKEFKNVNYIDLSMEKVLVKTSDIFGIYKPLMNILVIKKCWNEILKMTLYHYISCLLMTANKNQKNVEELRKKIKFDSGILTETYEPVVGHNLTISTLKIMDDIHDFLDISSYMISSSCLTLRQYIGSAFSISTAKALIKLRSDFSDEERNDAIEQCKEILENYNEPDNTDMGGYFQYMEKELKKQEKEEKKLEMLKMSQSQHENTSRHSLLYSKTFFNFNNQNNENSDSDDDSEDEEKKEEPIINMDLEAFLNEDSEEEEKNEEKMEEVKIEVSESTEYKEVSDIDHEGFMYKKSHTKWQRRYFQLKNGNLYWFIDKKSSIIQNKISIKDTEKVVSHKDKKFLMIVKERDDEKAKELKVKEYKFMCETEEEKIEWVLVITNAMKKLNNEKVLKKEEKLDIKVRKKIIHDLFKFPDINGETTYMRKKVLAAMNNENYFKPSARKIEADKKKALQEEEERKIREKIEMERKKKEEKEERERKKREEKERQLKEEMEREKQIEKDIKEGKSVGVTNRIKFWFKGLGKGNDEKEEEVKANNPINNNNNNNNEEEINNFNLDDFMNASSDEEENKEENKEEKIEEKKEEKIEEKKEEKKEEKIEENKEEKKEDKDKVDENEKKVEIKNDNKINENTKNKENNNNEEIKTKEKEDNKEKENNNKLNEEKDKEIENNKKEEKIIEEKIEDKNKLINEDKNKETKNNKKSDDEEEEEDEDKIDTLKIGKNEEEEKKEVSSGEEEVDIKDLLKNNTQKEKEKKENEENNNSINNESSINIDNSKLNNADYDIDLYSDKGDEKEKKSKKKEKKGFFSNIFSCGSTNEERNVRRKKKKERKNEQKEIEEEIKMLKKEQDALKIKKKEVEKEMKKKQENKNKLNKKKFTIIQEEKSYDEEEEKNDENTKNNNNKNPVISDSDSNSNSDKEEDKNQKKIENEKLKFLESNNENEEEKNNNKDEKNEEDKNKEEEKENKSYESENESEDINKDKDKEKGKDKEKDLEDENNKINNDYEEMSLKDNNIKEEMKNKENKEIEKEKKKKKLRSKNQKRLTLEESDKISEKSKESEDEEEKEKESQEEKEKKENDEKRNNLLNYNQNIYNNESIEVLDFLGIDKEKEKYKEKDKEKEEKKSFNRYSETGTYNFSNNDYNENIEFNDEETDSNNIVNFLAKSNNESKKESHLSKNNIEEDDDEKEYLNNNINKKIIKNSDNIEIIQEKKEEEEESEEQREKSLNELKNIRKASIVQIVEVKHILSNNNSDSNKGKIDKDYINNISQKLIKKTKKADKIMRGMKNNKTRNKLEEKIAKIKNEIPDIKTKYEISLEEEKNKNEENDEYNLELNENKNEEENNKKVNDWWGDIFS